MIRQFFFTALFTSAFLFAETVGTSFLWSGAVDTSGRVITGSTNETSGFWYEFTDNPNGGTSSWNWPDDVTENEYGNFFGPLVKTHGKILGTYKLGRVTGEKPFVGIGFNVRDSDQKGADVSAWKGICLEYQATKAFSVQFRGENSDTPFKANVPGSDSPSVVNIPWSDFQLGIIGPGPGFEDVVAKVATVHLLFSGDSGTMGEFTLTKIGSFGACDEFSAIFRAKIPVRAKVRRIAPDKLSVENAAIGTPYRIFDLNGNLLKSGKLTPERIVHMPPTPAILKCGK